MFGLNLMASSMKKEVAGLEQQKEELKDLRKSILKGFKLARKERIETLKEKEIEERKRHLLEDMTNATSALMWRKDEKGRLLYANRRMCSFFLGLPDHCTYEVEGQSVEELLEVFIAKTGEPHGFIDIVGVTDYIVKTEKKTSRFIETGRIADKTIMLYVTKCPVLSDIGDFKGTVGIALDASKRCKEIVTRMEEQSNTGSVIKLGEGIYWLLDGDECSFIPA